MSDIHEHMRAQVLRHKHKFPATLYRGVPITEFNAEELRALICILGEMGERDRETRINDADILNSLRTGRQHD
jgi:hypothetical protein